MMKRTLLVAALALSLTVVLHASSTRSMSAQSPWLKTIQEYTYLPVLDSNPHGRLNLIVPIKKLKDDGNTTYDWYFYEARMEAVPGVIAYDSNWRTDHTWGYHDITFNQGVNRWLTDHDPTTTSGQTTVTVSLTAASSPTFSTSWSYTVSDVVVLDKSDASIHRAAWEHDIDPFSMVAENTYLHKPGFVERTNQNFASLMDAWYQVRFARRVCCWFWDTETVGPTTNLNLDAFEAD
mgnify:CR=1 FL=1